MLFNRTRRDMYSETCDAGLMYQVTQSLGPIRFDRQPPEKEREGRILLGYMDLSWRRFKALHGDGPNFLIISKPGNPGRFYFRT